MLFSSFIPVFGCGLVLYTLGSCLTCLSIIGLRVWEGKEEGKSIGYSLL